MGAAEQAALACRSRFDCEFRFRTRSGRVVWVHARSAPREQSDGSVAWDGVVLDVTDRRRAEEALREERDFAEALVTGVGIPPESLARVFEPFTQLSNPPGRRPQGGLGIGLTLVKRLVELHGGVVESRSEGLGRGSEFVVRLPLAGDGSDTKADGSHEGLTAGG